MAKIIVIEGTDGSGKETQSKKLEAYYLEQGYKVKRYSFPEYESATGKIVGGPFLGKPEIMDTFFEETSSKVDPLVSSLYYAADRRYNFLKKIEADLEEQDIVILDRYTTSNMGFQVAKAKTIEHRDKILRFLDILEYDLCELPRPDLVLFLHMPFEAATELRKGREFSDGNEADLEYQKHSENTYLYLCDKCNWQYINCINGKYQNINNIKSIDEISEEIITIVDKELKKENNQMKKMTRY
jgi:dTMP kinase